MGSSLTMAMIFYGFQLTINQATLLLKDKVKPYSQQEASKIVSDLLVEKGTL